MCAPCKIVLDQDVIDESNRTLRIMEQARALGLEVFSDAELNAMSRRDMAWLKQRRADNDEAVRKMLVAGKILE